MIVFLSVWRLRMSAFRGMSSLSVFAVLAVFSNSFTIALSGCSSDSHLVIQVEF